MKFWSRKHPVNASALQDFIAFYGLSFIAPLIWLVELAPDKRSPIFFISLIANAIFCLWQLSRVWRGVQSDSEVQADWLSLSPLFCGLCWLGLSGTANGLESGSIVIFMLLSVLLLLAVMPMGSRLAFGYSVPVLLADNLVVLNGPWDESLRISILLNLAFFGFWYGALRVSGSLIAPSADEPPDKIDRLLSELAQSRESFEDARNSRLELEARMAEKERDMELTIRDRTRELQDANAQLNQQIALRKTISDALVKSQTRLTQAIDASRLGLIDWDVAKGQFYQSAFHEIYGDKEQSSDQVVVTLKRIIHPDDYPHVRDTINSSLAGEINSYQLQYRVKSEDGWLWIEESGKVVDVDANGNAVRLLGTRRNIQNEMRRDEQVRLAKSVFDHTSEGVFVLDNEGRFLSVNPAYEEINGRSSEDLVGQRLQEISGTPEKENVYAQIFDELKAAGRWQGELLEKRHRGDYFPQWTQINAIEDDRHNIKYFAGLVSDLTDRKAADEQLDYLINYDDLTKLANRVQFRDQLHRAFLRFKDKQIPFALVMLDVDRFKRFNDSFGHEASDSLLKDLAQRLTASVQKVDILARVGGNEFACLVACSKTFDIKKFAERLFTSVTQGYYNIDNTELLLSCSMGVAQVPRDAEDIETLMQNASLAVQKAKYQGGNQIQYFDSSLISFSSYRLELERDLRSAIRDKDLEVYYQPKLNVKSGLITSLEALIRWDHPKKGRIPPEEFVSIAEENGLITELGSYVLETACHQVKLWSKQGLGDLSVSVNLSPRQLRETSIRDLISKTIKETEIDPQYLEFELTESAIMEDINGAKKMLNELRDTGIKISIDDFGTGYSSLSYLKELPIDTLKIDRAFIESFEHSHQQQAIVRAIVVLAHSLDLIVVAEGVENDDQLGLLRELECDYVQGYYVSRPVSVDALEVLLVEQVQESTGLL